MSAPRVKDELHAITARGGRVVVVDPRRSETAAAFEHVPIRPDTDAWMLLAMLHVIFEEGLEDAEALARQARGADALRELVAPHTPEQAEARTGVPAATVRKLARALANAESAAVYGRTGSCLGRNGTLVSFLLDSLNAVTGNLDRPGGAMFGSPPIDFEGIAHRLGLATYDSVRSRIGNFPDVLGSLPASLMAKEITTPGEGQMRALFVSAGNPVLSCPNGDELEAAIGQLDLCVAIDFYVSETAKHADYVLPATTFLEREDYPLPFLGLFTTPFINATEAVAEPAGEARQEWEIIEDLSRRIGIVPQSHRLLRLVGGLPGRPLTPRRLVELLLRTGPRGDLFGLRRRGLNLRKLHEAEHGIVLDEYLAAGVMRGKIRHRDRRVHLDQPEIVTEVAAISARNGADPEFPLTLISMRELRSHNSWMHNAALLMRGGREHFARVNPDDAAAAAIGDGDEIAVSSAHGSVSLPARLTDETIAGTVIIPHGWGHAGGWRLANEAGGVNVNRLASSEPEDLERLAGMAHLSGIPVRIERVGPGRGADSEGEGAKATLAG